MARAVVILVGVVIIAWSAIAARDVHLDSRGLAEASRLTRTGLLAADRDLRGATLLNADAQPRIDRAEVDLLRLRPGAALVLANGVVADEPENLAAWVMVWQAGLKVDRARARQAEARLVALNPVAAR